ncbi:DUF3301 domain-containing protein [Agarilytica rhodophyticola]|uniref:DUF3301 domain-containing protein n=1 Tax=Agarilytica rhodophyticola TaxID=1737490 RepID=UPI000B341A48|nr:DUF3301 domain-containing protein [Agarilytica rhodophyticola]
MTIYDVFLATIFFALIYALWVHANMSNAARLAAKKHCQQVGVQLLDQNVILKRISIARSKASLFAFKRQYIFEFSTVGDFRYKGYITLLGNRIEDIELAPYKVL